MAARRLFIAIEGTTGVGNSTLAAFLAHRLNAGIFFGPFEANPFLPELYAAGHLASPELALRVELTIKELHLNELSRAFDAAFDRYPGPMLCLDADTFDVFNPQHVDQLTDTVRHLAAERTPR
jgi:deoxyadenosine/deoxycytidine kinase